MSDVILEINKMVEDFSEKHGIRVTDIEVNNEYMHRLRCHYSDLLEKHGGGELTSILGIPLKLKSSSLELITLSGVKGEKIHK